MDDSLPLVFVADPVDAFEGGVGLGVPAQLEPDRCSWMRQAMGGVWQQTERFAIEKCRRSAKSEA
jgi:hypothetical protein